MLNYFLMAEKKGAYWSTVYRQAKRKAGELIKAVIEERELDIGSDEEHMDIGNTGVAEDTYTGKS